MATITDIRKDGAGYKVWTSNYVVGHVTYDFEIMDEFCRFTGVDINHLRIKMIECE